MHAQIYHRLVPNVLYKMMYAESKFSHKKTLQLALPVFYRTTLCKDVCTRLVLTVLVLIEWCTQVQNSPSKHCDWPCLYFIEWLCGKDVCTRLVLTVLVLIEWCTPAQNSFRKNTATGPCLYFIEWLCGKNVCTLKFICVSQTSPNCTCIACIRLYCIGPCQVQQRWRSRAQTQHEGGFRVFYF